MASTTGTTGKLVNGYIPLEVDAVGIKNLGLPGLGRTGS